MPRIHATKLQEFVDAVNNSGLDFNAEAVKSAYYPLELDFDTVVDQNISPYSDEYLGQQIALYREISGRNLDQETGELHGGDLDTLLNAPNPIGIRRVEHMADQVRSLSTLLSLCCLGESSEVLDLGPGHGVSSEIFAFAGCRVHAIDLDPVLTELSRQRAAVRGFDIVRSQLNFDDLSTLDDGRYAAAYFFQSLHHCLRPWDLIATLKTKLAPDGVIGFAGEPMQNIWWKNWGIRLDPESLYAARANGWFESGWSHDFIRECFERAGMKLTFFNGGTGGTLFGMAALNATRRNALINKALTLGMREVDPSSDEAKMDAGFLSQVGEKVVLHGRPAFRQRPGEDGVLIFGPYASVAAGPYEMSVVARKNEHEHATAGHLTLDVVSNGGTVTWLSETVQVEAGNGQLITREFTLPVDLKDIELRVIVAKDQAMTVTFPALSRRDSTLG